MSNYKLVVFVLIVLSACVTQVKGEELSPGEHVLILHDGEKQRFILKSIQPRDLEVEEIKFGIVRRIPFSKIEMIEVRTPRTTGSGIRVGAGLGFVIGVAVGMGVGLIMGDDNEGMYRFRAEEKGILLAIPCSLIGAITGGIWKGINPGMRWKSVDLPVSTSGFSLEVSNGKCLISTRFCIAP